jgi:hypothetical protein
MIQNEIQSMHWHKTHITILGHINYCWNVWYDVQNPDLRPGIIKEVHYYIFDDNTHDTLYVQDSFMLH